MRHKLQVSQSSINNEHKKFQRPNQQTETVPFATQYHRTKQPYTIMTERAKLMRCFRTPKRGRDSEHWDTFKQKYPTDSFAKTTFYGKDYTAKRKKSVLLKFFGQDHTQRIDINYVPAYRNRLEGTIDPSIDSSSRTQPREFVIGDRWACFLKQRKFEKNQTNFEKCNRTEGRIRIDRKENRNASTRSKQMNQSSSSSAFSHRLMQTKMR